jgi:D-3-phosphoglycerate dehydrogenase
MDLVAFDPYANNGLPNITMVSLEELMASSRFIVLACPLTPETFHLINAERLALMRPDSYLINVARGPVVLEADLIDALKASQLAGAALDVFEVEPLPLDSELRMLPNVILGAHNGSNTREGVARASTKAVDFLLEELSR